MYSSIEKKWEYAKNIENHCSKIKIPSRKKKKREGDLKAIFNKYFIHFILHIILNNARTTVTYIILFYYILIIYIDIFIHLFNQYLPSVLGVFLLLNPLGFNRKY